MFLLDLSRKLLRRGEGQRDAGSLLSSLGIFLATFLVMIALGVLAGYQQVYRHAVLNFTSHVVVSKAGGMGRGDQRVVEQSLQDLKEKHPDLVYSPYLYYETLAAVSGRFEPVVFKGIDAGKLRALYPLKFSSETAPKDAVWVGKFLWEDPKVAQSRSLKFFVLPTDPELSEPDEKTSGVQSLKIFGSFETGYYDFDARFALMSLTDLQQRFFQGVSLIEGFEVRLADIDVVPALAAALQQSLGPAYDVVRWDELNHSLFAALALDRTVVFVVSFLIVMIACLNIFGFNFLFFMKKQQSLTVLWQLGLSRNHVAKLLSLVSLILGGRAAIFGWALGGVVLFFLAGPAKIPLNPEVYYVHHVPVAFAWWWFIVALTGTVVLCWVTSRLAGRVLQK